MKFKCLAWFSAAMLVLITLSAPGAARGDELVVEHTLTDPSHFTTIQAAIVSVTSRLVTTPNVSFTIRVKADPTPYSEPFTPISNITSIFGDSTTGTFLSGSGATPIVTLTNLPSVEIRNFTFKSASIGISVVNSSANITNNVFQLGPTSTAIQLQNATGAQAQIINNTFFDNGTAISTNSNVTIINNIFSNNNVTAISSSTTLTPSYNDYFANKANGIAPLDAFSIPNQLQLNPNPFFVNPSLLNGDFHLQSVSPCIGHGNTSYVNSFNTSSDMGAYGGPKSDILLETVTVLPPQTSGTPPSAVVLSWTPTGNTSVTAYRVYYGNASGVYNGTPQATVGTSPVKVPLGTNTQTLSGLPTTAPPVPAAPKLTGLVPLNQSTLQASWTPVTGATGYLVYYSTASFDVNSLPANPIPVSDGTISSVPIPNLATGVPYFVAVRALAQNTLFAAVTAVVDTTLASNPGSANESSFSQEVSEGFGLVAQSDGISNILSDFAEGTAPFPNLKSEGCFIATAAYGFYSAPQVQALRDFRDWFLLTNAPGRAFVAWYYHYGPIGAHYINLHPWLKAPVRLALLPLIVAALVLTGSSPLAKTGIVLLVALWCIVLLRRRKTLPSLPPALKKLFLALLLLLITLPALAQGAETRPDRPHWSLELKGGAFFPDTAGWSKAYGSSFMGEYGGALSYKVFRQVELGLEGSYLSASGKGQLPLHSATGNLALAGDVSYELAPLDLFVLARGIFREDQLLVPYAAAGYTRLFYREEVKGQGTTKGSVNGYHARAGVQLLLDGLEPDASRSLYLENGIYHTYLFLEGKYLHAKADTVPTGSVNLGGTSFLGGFLFEF
jgi:hypothetical protein